MLDSSHRPDRPPGTPYERYHPDDPLNPPRGVLIGVGYSALCYLILIAALAAFVYFG